MTTRIYTGTGDRGETGLFGGVRVSKAHPRVAAYGALDELNAVIGWTLTLTRHPQIAERLALIQPDLFAIGAHLATVVRPGARPPKLPPLPEPRIAELEHWIDEADGSLPELTAFVMPGGSAGGAALHIARTVCRRAEREIVNLGAFDDSDGPAGVGGAASVADSVGVDGAAGVDGSIIIYMNRLADLLFVWARAENQHAGVAERQWLPEGQ